MSQGSLKEFFMNYDLENKNNSYYDHALPYFQRVVFSIFFGTFFAVGFITNLIAILVYIKNKKIKKSSCFLINLCISDLLILIVCMPVAITDLSSVNDQWLHGEFYCN